MFKVGDIIRPKLIADKFYAFTNATHVKTMVVTKISTEYFLAKVKEFTETTSFNADGEYSLRYELFELASPTKKLKLISKTRIK